VLFLVWCFGLEEKKNGFRLAISTSQRDRQIARLCL